MKKFTPLASALALLFVFTSCDSQDPPPPPPVAKPAEEEALPKKDEATAVAKLTNAQRESLLTKGDKASAALMKNLGAQLKAAMESGGPVAAINVCKTAGLTITESTSGEFENLTISRTSPKPRNPANAPDETDRAQFALWQAVTEKDVAPKPQLRPDPDGTSIRYYKPIVIADLCLNCHGPKDALKPELITLLAKLYPEDQATGYKLGDLRGAFRVTIDPN